MESSVLRASNRGLSLWDVDNLDTISLRVDEGLLRQHVSNSSRLPAAAPRKDDDQNMSIMDRSKSIEFSGKNVNRFQFSKKKLLLEG